MGKKLAIVCPHCSSLKTKRNGHHYGAKLQFFCHSCRKYFSIDVAKGYPVSKIPFQLIAYLLYFRKRIPAFSNMREYRRFVSQWLKCLSLRGTDVDRHTIRHWIINYEPIFEQLISFQETCNYVHNILYEILKGLSKDVIKAKTHPYNKTLSFLEQSFGRDFCISLARSDPAFFHELTDLVSRQQLYCQRIKMKAEHQPDLNLFFKGVVQ